MSSGYCIDQEVDIKIWCTKVTKGSNKLILPWQLTEFLVENVVAIIVSSRMNAYCRNREHMCKPYEFLQERA